MARTTYLLEKSVIWMLLTGSTYIKLHEIFGLQEVLTKDVSVCHLGQIERGVQAIKRLSITAQEISTENLDVFSREALTGASCPIKMLRT